MEEAKNEQASRQDGQAPSAFDFKQKFIESQNLAIVFYLNFDPLSLHFNSK